MKSISFLASLAALSVISMSVSCGTKSDAKDTADGGSGTAGSGTAGAAGSGTAGNGTAGTAGGGTAGTAGSGTAGAAGSGTAGAAGSGTAGSSGSAGAAGTGPGTPGWTQVPLIDDTTDPNNTLHRKDSDWVSGIYFSSVDDGWVVSRQGGPGSDISGGAVFKATSTSVTSVLFSGMADPLCETIIGGGIDFNGIQRFGNDFIALHAACSLIASHDGGKTFGIELNSGPNELGINHTYAFRQLTGGGTLMFQDRIISTSAKVPGTMSIGNWTEVWAPEGNPPTPNPVPTNECQVAQTNNNLWEPGVAYVSANADMIAYVAHDDTLGPIVCISKETVAEGAVRKFIPSVLTVDTDVDFAAPQGVIFTSAMNGIVYYGNSTYPGKEYVLRTTDGGTTWTPATLPPKVVSNADGVEFTSGFFAPDGMHGWIVGLNHKGFGQPFVMRTADGGATWSDDAGDLVAKAMFTGVGRLYTGFALDENHIWVGGDSGLLLYNAAGGI